jgi:hypothetical protein
MKTKEPDRPESQRIYRYWVEIRELRDGSVLNLPLTALRLVQLDGKRAESPQPDEQRLRLHDDATVIEARDRDELAATLQSKYPDATHERRLYWERDPEAEQRYAGALDALMELVVEAVVNDVLREHDAEQREIAPTQVHLQLRAPLI